MAKPVMIGSRFYSKKKDAEDACRVVLYRYQVGEMIQDPDDEEFLHDLLDLHQDAEGKRGVGISHFEIRENDFRRPGFYIVRVDGSWTDFSFIKCLTPVGQRYRVLDAFRRTVVDQILAFKNAAFADGVPTCAVTGVALDHDSMHIDHLKPEFNELAERYVAAHGGWDAFPVVHGDGVIGARLANPQQELGWAEYHRANANLQTTSKIANLSLRRTGLKRPPKAI